MSRKSPRVKFRMDVRDNNLEGNILKFLSKFGYMVLDANLPKKYGSCLIWRKIFGLDVTKEEKRKKEWKRTISNTLDRLMMKDLVVRDTLKEKTRWKLSPKGQRTIQKFNRTLPQADDKLRIFIFDIPESKKYYRDWLRQQLIIAKYRMLQRSVWIGKRPLSHDLIIQIQDKKLWKDAYFFEVKEIGTLENLNIGS